MKSQIEMVERTPASSSSRFRFGWRHAGPNGLEMDDTMTAEALRSIEDRAPASLLIRDAAETDVRAIQTIYAHHVLHGLATFEEVPPSIAEMAARRAAVLGAGLPYLVAERCGRVVVYAYAASYRPRPAYRYTIEDSIYVEDGFGGGGIGSALLASLLARCEAGPWRQMLAVIGNSGNAGSIALHRKLGFTPVGTFAGVGFKFGQWVDTVLMQRVLGEGTASRPAPVENRAG